MTLGVGLGVRCAAAPPALATYVSNGTDPSGTLTKTYTSQNIGVAAADRFVIVACVAQRNGACSISGVTIGGNAATKLLETKDANTQNVVSIWGLLVPTGTTANIVVSHSATPNFGGIAVYSATGLQSTTPVNTQTSTANPPSMAITGISNGFILAVAATQAAATFTWTNAAEDTDVSVTNISFSSALTAVAGAVTITGTPTSGTANRYVGAAIAMR